MTDGKSRFSFLDVPSENAARAVLLMEYVWTELNEYILLEQLAALYNFDVITLEVAARELERLNILESKTGTVIRKFFFCIPYQAEVAYFRRRKVEFTG